jgi:hypothetical protein
MASSMYRCVGSGECVEAGFQKFPHNAQLLVILVTGSALMLSSSYVLQYDPMPQIRNLISHA